MSKRGKLALGRARIGYLERRHPPHHQGSVSVELTTILRDRGAEVDVVHADEGRHSLTSRPVWDLVVLKSGSAAALHLAAAAEGYGVRCVNAPEPTRLARDKLASTAILRRAGLPVPHSYATWLDPSTVLPPGFDERTWVVKAARGWHGKGVWVSAGEELASLVASLPAGPYVLMEHVEHVGDDLKVFVAGAWMTAIERPFPATSLMDKRGRPVPLPSDVAEVCAQVGRALGLLCYGCDFVAGPVGWALVDVNAFPGYKGAEGAASALADAITTARHGDGP